MTRSLNQLGAFIDQRDYRSRTSRPGHTPELPAHAGGDDVSLKTLDGSLSVGGKQLLDHVATAHPSVAEVAADGGSQGTVINHGAGLGIDVEVVERPTRSRFQPLAKRWVIERTFGWLMQHRRLARDYKALPQRSQAMIHWVLADKMSRALTGESTPTWRIEKGVNTP
ncbi:transposase [Streptomyces xantholiticus]|uniref:transposase n=1 Tax=Streptomyces xantholiticus TaxID=68285 RepID=UPI0019A7E10B|nr:transposase [Streptomyces xantholiticus]GGW65195.1 hypothetical protein GCM10010381_57700 [Streptomyces xantholiticus]